MFRFCLPFPLLSVAESVPYTVNGGQTVKIVYTYISCVCYTAKQSRNLILYHDVPEYTSSSERQLKPAISSIHDGSTSYCTPLNIHQVCTACGNSNSYFSSVFTQKGTYTAPVLDNNVYPDI